MRNKAKAPDARKFIIAAGGHSRVAAHMGIAAPSVHKWKCIPPERVLDMEKIFEGKKYTRYQMRPDVFGKDPAKGKKAVA